MKKIILLAAAIMALAGCRPLDRANPTDPAGTAYAGWTYIGEIGSFSSLSDFTLYFPNVSDPSQDSLLTVDRANNEVSSYLVSGAPEWVVSQAEIPEITAPTGVAERNGYCFILEKAHMESFQITTGSTLYLSDVTLTGDKVLSYGGFLYAAVSDTPGVTVYSSVDNFNSHTTAGTWAIAKGDTSCANCMGVISDIAAHASTNEIILADSGLQRISIFTTGGGFVDTIDVGSPVWGVAADSDTVYVPTTDGIRMYDYASRNYIKTIANYGEGNGRVVKPGPIELYGGRYIFVGAGTSIKYFETTGL